MSFQVNGFHFDDHEWEKALEYARHVALRDECKVTVWESLPGLPINPALTVTPEQ